MKRVYKRIGSIALSAVMALSLAACGGNDDEKSGSNKTTKQEEQANKTEEGESASDVTLKFANYAVLEQGYTEFWEGVKKDYEEAHDNVTVEYVSAPYNEIVNTIINMAASGNRVDLLFGEISWVPGLMDTGLASPVEDILSQEFLDTFYPNVMEDYEIDGSHYGLPLYISPFVLYCNKDILKEAGFDAPPETYDEMMSMADEIAKLKTDDGNKIYPFGQTTASVPVSGVALNAMIFTMGGRLFDDEGNLSVDNDGFKQTFELLQELDKKQYNPQNAKLKDLRNLFALGQLAMYYDQSWGFNGISSINEDAADFAISAKPLKGGSGEGKSMLQAHSIILVDNGEEQTAALSDFVEYLISEDTLQDYLQNITPAYPATKSMADMELNPVLEGAKGSESEVISQPFIPEISDIDLELASLAQAVTVNQKDVDGAIAEFKTKAETILK